MLDVVRLAAQARLPLRVDVLAVVGVHDLQERFVGQRRPLGHAEDAMVFVGPREDIAADVQSPTADLPNGLGPGQILPALAERRECLLGLPASGHGVLHQAERGTAGLAQRLLGPFSLGRFLDDDAQADDLPLSIRDGQPVLQPASLDPRLGRRLADNLDVEPRLPGFQDATHLRFDGLGQLGHQVTNPFAEVRGGRQAVDLGQTLVDPNPT